MEKQLNNLSDKELINLYPTLLKQLKKRNIIRTNNLVGDLGETLAIDYYNSQKELPNLRQAETNEKGYDALTTKNKRYTIKSTSTKQTGIFWGLEPKGSTDQDKKIFDFLVIVKFTKDYEVEAIYEMNWRQFSKNKKWHGTTKAWNIRLTKELLDQLVKRK